MSLYLHGVSLAVVSSAMMVLPNAFAEESSKPQEKQRAPDTRRDMERDAQMMLGGAKYFVIGPISRIDDNYFYVKDEELGDEVRLVMDEGSKVICVFKLPKDQSETACAHPNTPPLLTLLICRRSTPPFCTTHLIA